MPESTVVEFLRPHLRGARFQGAAIPLEVLRDLAVLEELIVEVAKWRFLEDNPNRRRSPRGFTQGLELKLTAVEDGSAIPVISLFLATLTLPGVPASNQVYFEGARDSVVSAIAAAERNESVARHLPENCLAYFDRIGRSLRDDESMDFPVPNSDTPARLTKESRRKLVLASSRTKEITEEVALRGTVPEADQDVMTFQLQLLDGRKITSPVPEQHLGTILDAFAGYQQGTRVLLQGIGTFNRQERLVGIDSIEYLSLLDPLDVPARLDELRALRDGWLEGRGRAPDPQGLDWFSDSFDLSFPDGLPLPHVYPTAEGGIQAEWALNGYDASLEVDLTTHEAHWHRLALASAVEESHDLNLDDATDWAWLASQIATLEEGEA